MRDTAVMLCNQNMRYSCRVGANLHPSKAATNGGYLNQSCVGDWGRTGCCAQERIGEAYFSANTGTPMDPYQFGRNFLGNIILGEVVFGARKGSVFLQPAARCSSVLEPGGPVGSLQAIRCQG